MGNRKTAGWLALDPGASSPFSPVQIFGFVATFLCLASVWLSYKISCVTQSTGECWLSEHR